MGCILAEKLAQNGIFPLLSYKRMDGKDRIEKRLGSSSIEYEAFHLDFADGQNSISRLENKIAGGVDFLVDFAQEDYESLVAGADDGAMTAFFNANIGVRALVIKRVARAMLRQQKGRMIFISSTAAGRPNPGQGFYAAAKLASEALYKNIGLELAHKGVTTLSIRPGYVNSGRGTAYLARCEDDVKNQIPTGAALDPGQVADAVMFYLSDHAGQFNATQVTLDGGFSAGKKTN